MAEAKNKVEPMTLAKWEKSSADKKADKKAAVVNKKVAKKGK